MALYISLITFADQGVRNAKDTTKRAEAAKEMGKKMGVNMTQIYWTLGHYDLVAVLDAPNEEAAAAFGLWVSSGGNVRTETMRAFSADEMKGVLAKLP